MDHRRQLVLREARFPRRSGTTRPPLCRGNSTEFTRLALQPRRQPALSCARRRGTLSSRQADGSPEVHPFPHQGHGKRTNGLEGQGGSFLVKSRRQSPRRLPPHLGLQRAASRRRKMVPRLGPTRRQTRNLAARRFRTLARRTHAGGQEKRVGPIAFRGPQISSRAAPLVHHHGQSFVLSPPNRAAAGGEKPALTLSQVRDAANALVTTLPFDAESRLTYLERVSTILKRTQTRNQQARRSHFKSCRRRLHAIGLFTSCMRSCMPP